MAYDEPDEPTGAYDEPDDPTGLDQVDEMTIGAETDDQLSDEDTLADNPTGDPLDTGIIPPDSFTPRSRYGTTEAEEEAGEPLDMLLAEEEPEVDPYAEAEQEDEEADSEDELLEEEDLPDPRAGRLVAEDEGAHPDAEADLVASDVGIDAGAAGAEEAAVHVIGEDEDELPGLPPEAPPPPGGSTGPEPAASRLCRRPVRHRPGPGGPDRPKS